MDSQILKLISGEAGLVLKALDGTENMAEALINWPTGSDRVSKNSQSSRPGLATEETLIYVYEQRGDATFLEMFNSLTNNLDEIVMTEHQVKQSCQDFEKWLTTNGNIFLIKEGEKYYACWAILSCGRLRIHKLDFFTSYSRYSSSTRFHLFIPRLSATRSKLIKSNSETDPSKISDNCVIDKTPDYQTGDCQTKGYFYVPPDFKIRKPLQIQPLYLLGLDPEEEKKIFPGGISIEEGFSFNHNAGTKLDRPLPIMPHGATLLSNYFYDSDVATMTRWEIDACCMYFPPESDETFIFLIRDAQDKLWGLVAYRNKDGLLTADISQKTYLMFVNEENSILLTPNRGENIF